MVFAEAPGGARVAGDDDVEAVGRELLLIVRHVEAPSQDFQGVCRLADLISWDRLDQVIAGGGERRWPVLELAVWRPLVPQQAIGQDGEAMLVEAFAAADKGGRRGV